MNKKCKKLCLRSFLLCYSILYFKRQNVVFDKVTSTRVQFIIFSIHRTIFFVNKIYLNN